MNRQKFKEKIDEIAKLKDVARIRLLPYTPIKSAPNARPYEISDSVGNSVVLIADPDPGEQGVYNVFWNLILLISPFGKWVDDESAWCNEVWCGVCCNQFIAVKDLKEFLECYLKESA